MRLNGKKILILVLLPVVLFSCTSRKNKIENSHLIPVSDLTTIITDIYITNGLLTIPRVHNWYTPADTLTPYTDVIEKHGYKKEDLDRTLKWYFIRNPKKLEKIYDNVLARLSEMESRYEQEVEIFQSRVLNLWKGKEIYAAPDIANDSSAFDIKITHPGVFLLNFTATVFPDDETVNPKMLIYAVLPDSTGNSPKEYFNTMEYIKDGQPHSYTIKLNITNQNYFNIHGWFIKPCQPDALRKHFIIENISLTLSSAPIA